MTATAVSMPSEISHWRPPGRPPQIVAATAAPASLQPTPRHQKQQKQQPEQDRRYCHATAPVLEFRCLYTHDIRRKAKRWQDGFLRFHTFNRRVMVYDVPRNFVGDTHWSGHCASGGGDGRGSGAEVVEEGDELKLDSGILVEVAEAVGKTETDLSGLIRRRTVTRDTKSHNVEPPRNTSLYSGPDSSAAATDPYIHRCVGSRRHEQSQPQAQRKHKSLSSLLGTPKGPHGRATLPKQSPFDILNDYHEFGDTSQKAKRQRIDGHGSKENVCPHAFYQGVPSSPLTDRRRGDCQRVGMQNVRPLEENEDAPTDLGLEDVLLSSPYGVRSRSSPNYDTTSNAPEILQRSSSPCSISPAKKTTGAPASEKIDESTRTRNEDKRKLQPQTLRIGSAKPRKMLLTESLNCEIDEQPRETPEKITDPALESSRNGSKRQKREQSGPVNKKATVRENISNVPNESSEQQEMLVSLGTDVHSLPPKSHTTHERRNNINYNTSNNDPDKVTTLPTLPLPVLPTISNEVSKSDINFARSTIMDTRHTSAQRTHPPLSPNKKSTNTSLSTSSTTRPGRAGGDTSKLAPLNSNILPITTSTNTDTTVTGTSTSTSTHDTTNPRPSTNKHVSALHRPFRRVRSIPSNTNANTNINTDTDDNPDDHVTSYAKNLVKAGHVDRTITNNTNNTKITSHDDDDVSDTRVTGYHYHDSILSSSSSPPSSSPAAPAAAPYAKVSPRPSGTEEKETIISASSLATAMPKQIGMEMELPIAEETGAWSVEALDLFNWRPPDWGQRMEREMERERERARLRRRRSSGQMQMQM